MSKIVNTQYEMMCLKKLIEAKDPELLAKINFDLIANTELSNIFRLVGILYAENGVMPSFDLVAAELANRVQNVEKQEFYMQLVKDIRDKDAAGISTEDVIGKLKVQQQFRVALAGAGKLLDAVDKRDADETVGILRGLYEDMFKANGTDTLDSSDMVHMAGKEVKYDFHKTGIRELDKRGAWINCGLFGIAGASKAGKSLLTQQIMTFGHDTYGGSSCMYSYEQSPQELRARLLSAKAEIDIGAVTANLLTPFQRMDLRVAEVKHLCHFDDNMRDFCDQMKATPDDEFWPMFWDHFKPRDDRYYLPNYGGNWDELFLHMKMLADIKNVKRFAIDYPMLVPRGRTEPKLAQWEYTLSMSRKLKAFARENDVRILTPMQFDDKNDHIRFAQNVICDMDLLIAMRHTDEDKELGDTVTVEYKAFRNYLSVPDEPTLQPFKLRKVFNHCKFEDFSF